MTFIGPIIQSIESGSGSGLSSYTPLVATLVAFVGNIIGVVFFANIWGRRPLLIVSAVLMMLTNISSAVVMQFDLQWAFFALIILEMFVYGAFSLAPGWTYPNEVVSPDRVALQNSLTALALALAVILNPIVYNVMPGKNAFPIFYFYGLWNIAGILLFVFVMVESRNRTYKQIISLY